MHTGSACGQQRSRGCLQRAACGGHSAARGLAPLRAGEGTAGWTLPPLTALRAADKRPHSASPRPAAAAAGYCNDPESLVLAPGSASPLSRAKMAVDTATELLFLDTFKHQSAEVTRRGRPGPPPRSSSRCCRRPPARAGAFPGGGGGWGARSGAGRARLGRPGSGSRLTRGWQEGAAPGLVPLAGDLPLLPAWLRSLSGAAEPGPAVRPARCPGLREGTSTGRSQDIETTVGRSWWENKRIKLVGELRRE